MTVKEFQLIDAIFSEGLCNDNVIMVRDIESTKEYFGSEMDLKLEGKYVVVFRNDDSLYPCLDKFTPDIILENNDEDIFIYSIND